MEHRPYYSVRTGKHPTAGRLDLDGLKRLVLSAFQELEGASYFQQAFGHYCVDAGFIFGSVGTDIEAFFFRKLGKQDLWPLADAIVRYSEDDLFDVVELLHDCVSEGAEGRYHSYSDCGWHYETFDKQAGQSKFRASINEIIQIYDRGYELTPVGEITEIVPLGLADLVSAPQPPGDPDNVQARISSASDKFRRRGSSAQERRDAVRDLADVLEYLRPRAEKVLHSKDERDLFELANRFGIRHHNQQQKTDYDAPVWLSWMYYYYLATIHAVTRLIDRSERVS